MKRVLKVESWGDFPKKKRKAQIRLKGMWLILAGIPPDSHIEVSNPQKGLLILRVQE